MLTLADVLTGLTGLELPGAVLHTLCGAEAVLGTPVAQFVIDSREAMPGSMFIALPGEQADGHDFVGEAFRRGAAAALVHRAVPGDWATIDVASRQLAPADLEGLQLPVCIRVADSLTGLQRIAAHWRSKFSVRVIAITGSVGKSTTKELTWAVLCRRYSTLKSPGNLNNEIGLPLTLLRLDASHERVVLEMGMYYLGEIAQLCAMARPQVGVITNVGPTHLERLGSVERIAAAKSELVQALPQDGVAVLNFDDALVREMAHSAPPGVRLFTYGLSTDADLWASDVASEGLEGVRFILHHKRNAMHVKVPLLGRHSVHTALRATAVGLVEGMAWEDILGGLQNSNVQLRLVSVSGIHGSTLLDDTYNASPASTIAALNLLDDLKVGGRRIAVLGDMAELGSYTEEGHRKVGCRVVGTVALLVTVGERARLIAGEARACGMPARAVIETATNQEAIARLREFVGAGDIILVKGSRSMAMEEIVVALQVSTSRY
jgi:UDP-N-acetylmuramoyl-tripeptide--D-alanyl-D-alanine ligase